MHGSKVHGQGINSQKSGGSHEGNTNASIFRTGLPAKII